MVAGHHDREVSKSIVLDRPPATVWGALTTAASLTEWFGASVEIDARLGGRASFRWHDGRQRYAIVEAFDPPRLLILRWLPFERRVAGQSIPAAGGVVKFALQAIGDRTKLTVSESRSVTPERPNMLQLQAP